jgi:hypothetical protein
MQRDKPLVLKLTANLTAHGTMIFVPAYWSLDWKRDVNTKAIAALHKARVPQRQGPSIAEGREKQRELKAKLRRLLAVVKKRGLRGEARHEYLCGGLGLSPQTDPAQIRRLARMR